MQSESYTHRSARVQGQETCRPGNPWQGGNHGSGIAGSRQLATEEAFTLVVREHQAHVERLALELGQARATVEQLERTRRAEADAQAAHRERLEVELGSVKQLARAIGDHAQREQARATAAEEQLAQERTRTDQLERLAQAPWYAVRERKRLRRELA